MLFKDKWAVASFRVDLGHTVCSKTTPHAESI